VAGWIKNTAAVLAHASAAADPDVRRGNALVGEIEPHLWPDSRVAQAEAPPPDRPPLPPEPGAPAVGAGAPPVVLAEPKPAEPAPDPLAAIRGDLDGAAGPARSAVDAPASPAAGPDLPPGPPGPVATTAIQMTGYLVGWATVILALPLGLVRALWLWRAHKADLRRIGSEDRGEARRP
jgi:hypothetical protein